MNKEKRSIYLKVNNKKLENELVLSEQLRKVVGYLANKNKIKSDGFFWNPATVGDDFMMDKFTLKIDFL